MLGRQREKERELVRGRGCHHAKSVCLALDEKSDAGQAERLAGIKTLGGSLRRGRRVDDQGKWKEDGELRRDLTRSQSDGRPSSFQLTFDLWSITTSWRTQSHPVDNHSSTPMIPRPTMQSQRESILSGTIGRERDRDDQARDVILTSGGRQRDKARLDYGS